MIILFLPLKDINDNNYCKCLTKYSYNFYIIHKTHPLNFMLLEPAIKAVG